MNIESAAGQPQAEIRESMERNLAQLEDAIASASRVANRSRAEVELVAVSKTHPTAAIVEAVSLGLHLFGENRVQEFAAKSAELEAIPASPQNGVPQVSFLRPGFSPSIRTQMRVHLIGHLQSNKAAKAVEIFDGIDSVDSLKLAEKLDEAAGNLQKRLSILLEIKLSHEESKAGLSPDSAELAQLLERLPSLKNLEAQGLMTIAPLAVSEDETRACFRRLRTLRDRLAATHPRLNLPVLSMGMSGDFPLAIAEGATRIRVGTALFGTRPGYPR
jgi:pyridoxal phosphate enzyme (YggS family)